MLCLYPHSPLNRNASCGISHDITAAHLCTYCCRRIHSYPSLPYLSLPWQNTLRIACVSSLHVSVLQSENWDLDNVWKSNGLDRGLQLTDVPSKGWSSASSSIAWDLFAHTIHQWLFHTKRCGSFYLFKSSYQIPSQKYSYQVTSPWLALDDPVHVVTLNHLLGAWQR